MLQDSIGPVQLDAREFRRAVNSHALICPHRLSPRASRCDTLRRNCTSRGRGCGRRAECASSIIRNIYVELLLLMSARVPLIVSFLNKSKTMGANILQTSISLSLS